MKITSFVKATAKISQIGTNMMRSLIVAGILLASLASVNAATTLLPNGMQCFTTAAGAVAGGSVYMYQPGTTTFKQSWQDSNQTVANPQPIPLDANGCAIIYGVGRYRQQVYTGADNTTPLFFDQLTTDTSAFNAVFWAGISGGTPNVITVVDPGFNGTDGSVIQFVALQTNTGAVTINPSGFAAIPVVKDTASGPIALTGGEIIQNNVISVVYYATSNTFHLLNTVIATAAGNQQPFCSVSNLKIINSGGTPNSILTITADQAVMQNASGNIIARSSINLNLNITSGNATSTANGMDGESPGTSNWLKIFLIDNGSGAASVATSQAGNNLTPNMPSGYTYKCRIGAMRVDGAGTLLRTTQRGRKASYILTPATNTAALPAITSGNSGNPAVPTWTPVAIGAFVPDTATAITGTLVNANNGTTLAILAPNGNYGAVNSTTIPPPVIFNATAATDARLWTFQLESTNIFYASSGGNTGQVYAYGWEDAVNAF